jgi:hypothetical protein
VSVAEKFSDVETDMEETATEENIEAADAVNRFQIKAPSTCCPHLFTRRGPMHDHSLCRHQVRPGTVTASLESKTE